MDSNSGGSHVPTLLVRSIVNVRFARPSRQSTATNALNQSTTRVYDFNTGLLTSTTDSNNRTTSFSYDNMLRLFQANYPDGGQITFSHQETTFPFTASSSKKITSSTNLTQTNVFDGLGRAKQSQLTSDPDCPTGDKTDTTYDVLGRVFSVSNPYCTTSDPTYGLTASTYDALGRVTQVTHPDNSTLLTTYTGRAMQVQDEGNGTQRVTRISQTEGLGRLIWRDRFSKERPAHHNGDTGKCGIMLNESVGSFQDRTK